MVERNLVVEIHIILNSEVKLEKMSGQDNWDFFLKKEIMFTLWISYVDMFMFYLSAKKNINYGLREYLEFYYIYDFASIWS